MAMLMAQLPVTTARAEGAAPVPQVTAQNPAISAVFNAYPTGGEALSKQVTGLIMSNPKLAPDLVIYMQNAPGLNRAQKLAAEHGLAVALEELKIKAADLGVPLVTKEGIVAAPLEDPWWIAAAILAVGAAICIAVCRSNTGGVVVTSTTTATVH
jgi:hypothetical protein